MYFSIIQSILAVTLIVAILIQQRGAGLGSAISGGTDASFSERRGSEKTIFRATIIIAIVFFALSIAHLII